MESFLTENLSEEERTKFSEKCTAAVDFIIKNLPEGKDGGEGHRIAIVTSGGTTVPLEQRAVRSIVNFSSGGRGAAVTEALLAQGYSVILLSRAGSLQPYTRGFEQKKLSVLDMVDDEGNLKAEVKEKVVKLRRIRSEVQPRLSIVHFDTVVEYLFCVKIACTQLMKHAVVRLATGKPQDRLLPVEILAAAVSDYYIPRSKMSAHKISGGDGLDLRLENVPKGLGVVASVWAKLPPAKEGADLSPTELISSMFVVSFKLETDVTILEKKATTNLTKYQGMHCVVANLLHNYKREVRLFTKDSKEPKIITCEEGEDIEPALVQSIAQAQTQFLKEKASQAS